MSIPVEWATELASFMGVGRRSSSEDLSSAYAKAASYISGLTPAPNFTEAETEKAACHILQDKVSLGFLARCNQTTPEKLAALEIVNDAGALAASSPARRYARGLRKIASGTRTSQAEFRLLCAKEDLSPFVLSKTASLFECSRDGLFLTHVNGAPIEGLEKEGAVCDFMETIGSALALHFHDMEKVARGITAPGSVPAEEIEKIAARVCNDGEKTASASDLSSLYEEMEKLALNTKRIFSVFKKGLGSKEVGKLAPTKGLQTQLGMLFGENAPRTLLSRAATSAEKGLSPKLPILQRAKISPPGSTLTGKSPLTPAKSEMTWAKTMKEAPGPKRPPERLTLPENLRGARPVSPAEQARMRQRLDALRRPREAPAGPAPQPQAVAEAQQRAALERLTRQRERRALERRQRQTERFQETPPRRQPPTEAPAPTAPAQVAEAPAPTAPAQVAEAPAPTAPAQVAATGGTTTPTPGGRAQAPTSPGQWWAGMSPNERMALLLGGSYMGGQALGR